MGWFGTQAGPATPCGCFEGCRIRRTSSCSALGAIYRRFLRSLSWDTGPTRETTPGLPNCCGRSAWPLAGDLAEAGACVNVVSGLGSGRCGNRLAKAATANPAETIMNAVIARAVKPLEEYTG